MDLGGAISGEHGLGTEKKQVLPRARGPGQDRAHAPHQGRFDPNGILNPGTIFDAPDPTPTTPTQETP